MAQVTVQSIGTGNSGGNVSSLAITAPTGIQVGDLLLGFSQSRSGTAITPPTGFTTILSSAPGGVNSIISFYKIAVTADTTASSYTVSIGGLSQMIGGILRITGYSTTTPVSAAGFTSTGSGLALGAPTVRTPSTSSLFLMAGVMDNISGSMTESYASSYTGTEHMDSAASNCTMAIASAVWDGTAAGDGTYGDAEGVFNFSNTTSSKIAQSLVVYSADDMPTATNVQYRTASWGQNNGASSFDTTGAGLAIGDFMLIHISAQGYTVTPPSGWNTALSSGSFVFWRIATSVDVAGHNYSFSSSGNYSSILFAAFSGVEVDAPINASSSAVAGSNPAGYTPTLPNGMHVLSTVLGTNTSTSGGTPAGHVTDGIEASGGKLYTLNYTAQSGGGGYFGNGEGNILSSGNSSTSATGVISPIYSGNDFGYYSSTSDTFAFVLAPFVDTRSVSVSDSITISEQSVGGYYFQVHAGEDLTVAEDTTELLYLFIPGAVDSVSVADWAQWFIDARHVDVSDSVTSSESDGATVIRDSHMSLARAPKGSGRPTAVNGSYMGISG